MMKKLNLGDLKVKSFVTDLEQTDVRTVKGGGDGAHGAVGVGATREKPDYFTKVHNCNENTSPYRCPTQEMLGHCVPQSALCGITGHGGCATLYAPYNGC